MDFVDTNYGVSMPSWAYTSFLQRTTQVEFPEECLLCQCPLGLIPHFYKIDVIDIDLANMLCQCPLGLIPHFYVGLFRPMY